MGNEQLTNIRAARKNRALAKMDKELHSVYERIGELLTKADHGDCLMRYEVGKLVREVAEGGTYGSGAVVLLAAALGQNKDSLYGAARVVACWNRNEFDRLLSRPTLHRRPLSFTHFVLLATIDDVDQRAAFLELCFANGLSTRELERALDKSRKSAPTRSSAETAREMISRATLCLRALEHLPELDVSEEEDPELWREVRATYRALVQRIEITLGRGDGGADWKRPSNFAAPRKSTDRADLGRRTVA